MNKVWTSMNGGKMVEVGEREKKLVKLEERGKRMEKKREKK